MLKLFHTGDIHLDSAFYRLSPLSRGAAQEHQRKIFKKMIEHVREEKYDVLLISGDLFDSPNVSPESERCVIDAFSSVGCPVIISPGNHDSYLNTPFYSSKELPENVYVFNSPELQCFEFESLGLRVCGYAFMNNMYTKRPLETFGLPEFDGVSVLCAHGELNTPLSNYAPLRESDIEECKFTYAALGHIHKTAEPVRRGNTVIAYSSFLEGRAFDEEGEGGALAVMIDGDGVRTSRKTFSEKFYRVEELDVSGATANEDILARVKDYIDRSGYGRETALRLILCGGVPSELTPDTKTPQLALQDRFLQLEIIDRTTPEFDGEALERDYTLRGEVYRTLLPRLESEDEQERRMAAEALKRALHAINISCAGGRA